MQEESTTDKTLTVIKELTGSIELISETLFLMAGKRVTLEEKAIRTSLHELAQIMAGTVAMLHKRFETGNYDIEEKFINDLSSLIEEVLDVVSELKKAIQYNLNYLEQYFEYDFLARLKNEHRFNERMNRLNRSFDS